ncbi:MAG TPA: hypothetical protein VN706_00665 [Gemmatimonadaceae bacterium]|nr:hypothetical protein [Gemmatimonadaceae bacterium]
MDILRNPPNPERDAQIKSRQQLAGKFGFILGCVASVAALGLNFYWKGVPEEFIGLAFYVLIAALNMPIGIMIGLLFEKWSRPKDLRPKK